MTTQRSASLRFLYALPLAWFAVRLPIVFGDASALLRHRVIRTTAHPPSPVARIGTMSITTTDPIISAIRHTLPAHGTHSEAQAMHMPRKAAAQLVAESPAPQPARPAIMSVPNVDQAWQLASDGYALLRSGRRREAAAKLQEANALLPNPAWQHDLGNLTGHWHGDAWLFARSGSDTPLSVNAPALGRSQLGARIDYLPDPLAARPLVIEARAARAVHGSTMQLAIGIGVRPLPTLPLRLTAERQIATGLNTRDAWSVRGEGGVSAIPLPGRFRLDAYGEAGVVGARSRDIFADGDARATRQLHSAFSIGTGVWAAAQPGAHRFDVGPTAVARLQHGRVGFAASLDYRFRIAGNARPGSGPALTLSAGF